MDPMFWVRLGPSLTGSRFSQVSHCGPGNEGDSLCPPKTHSKRLHGQEGRGKGLVFYSCLKMKPKAEGVCHQDSADFCFLCPWPFAEFFCFVFVLTQQALLQSDSFSSVPAHGVLAVISSGFESSPLYSGRWEALLHPAAKQGENPPEWGWLLLCYPGCYELGTQSTLHTPFCFNFIPDWLQWSHTPDTLTYLRAESGLVHQLVDWLSFSCAN